MGGFMSHLKFQTLLAAILFSLLIPTLGQAKSQKQCAYQKGQSCPYSAGSQHSAEIKKIKKKYAKDKQKHYKKVKLLKKSLNKAIQKNRPEDQIRSLHAELVAEKSMKMQLKLEKALKIKKLLSAEQLKGYSPFGTHSSCSHYGSHSCKSCCKAKKSCSKCTTGKKCHKCSRGHKKH